MADIAAELTSLATGYLQSGNLQAYVKTNYGPAIPIYTGASKDQGQGGGLADAIGLKAQLIIKDGKGNVIRTVGDPAPTEPLKVAALIAAGLALAVIVVRGL